MPGWASCLLSGRVADLAALRLFPNIEFAEIAGVYWLRGTALDDALEHELKKIPGLTRFALLPSDKLRPCDSRIPDRSLPSAIWRSLKQAVIATLPVAGLCGENSQKISLALVRDAEEQPAVALLVGLKTWVEYATSAPLVRLASLKFAAMENREVVILGGPLPGISGRLFAGAEGILVPCGFTWTPKVEAGVLRQLFELRPDDCVLLAEDNTHQVIRAEQFVPASRSAARRTTMDFTNA
jgi:hypothetical protein